MTTNTVEGFFSIFKRGMRHLPALRRAAPSPLSGGVRFRYTNRAATGLNDADRANFALLDVVGKRLTYETASRKR